MSCEDLAKIKINKTQSWPLSSRLHRQWSCVVSFFFFLNWDFSWLKKHSRHREKYGQFSKCLFFWMGQYCGDIFGLETYVHVNVCWMQGYFFAWIVRTICCEANWQITSPPWMWNKQLSLPLHPPNLLPQFQETPAAFKKDILTWKVKLQLIWRLCLHTQIPLVTCELQELILKKKCGNFTGSNVNWRRI